MFLSQNPTKLAFFATILVGWLVVFPSTHAYAGAPTAYQVDSTLSTFTFSANLDGSKFFEPLYYPGSMTNTLTGAMSVDLSSPGEIHLQLPQDLQFADHPSSGWAPFQTYTGNPQFTAVADDVYAGDAAFTSVALNQLGVSLPPTLQLAGGTFAADTLDWNFGTQNIAWEVPSIGHGTLDPIVLQNVVALPGHVDQVDGVPQITIPIDLRGSTIEAYSGFQVNVELVGQIVARPVVPQANVHVLAMPTNDLAYSQQTGQLYASLPADAMHPTGGIVAINAATATVGNVVDIGSVPQQLVSSSDGSLIHSVTNNGQTIVQFDPTTMTSPLQWTLSPPNPDGDTKVQSIVPVPGQPGEVMITYGAVNAVPSTEGTAVFHDGVPLPFTLGDGIGGGPEFTTIDPVTNVGYGFDNDITDPKSYVFSVTQNGIENIFADPPGSVLDLYGIHRMAAYNGRLYTDHGDVINLATHGIVGSFLGGGNFLVDPQLSRLFSVENVDSELVIRSYDLTSLELLGTFDVHGFPYPTTSLTRVGNSSLAFRDTQGFVIIVDLAAVPEPSTLALAAIGTVALLTHSVRRRFRPKDPRTPSTRSPDRSSSTTQESTPIV